MKERVTAGDSLLYTVDRTRGLRESMARALGMWDIEHRDPNGQLLSRQTVKNEIMIEGLRYLLDVGLGNATSYTQQTVWYIALLEGAIAVPGDGSWVYNGTSGWKTDNGLTELTNYTGSTPTGGFRQQWQEVLHASAAQIDNVTTKSVFNFSATGSVGAAALVSHTDRTGGNDEGTATDYLFSYTLFGSTVSVANGDTLSVSSTITLADT